MPVVFQLTILLSAALTFCTYIGWGLARLALPPTLAEYRALLVPLVGYATAVWFGYLAVHSFFNLRIALLLLFVLASGLNVLAWRRTGPPQIAWFRAELGVILVVALALLAGIWPLLAYGYVTTIGRGWDPESYLPMAQHLVDYRLSDIPYAPSNPLRGLVSDPPRIGLTLGFSVFQGFTMLLSGQSALDTFAPLLALLRAFGILAAYVWFRSSMGLRRIAATLAVAYAAAGSLMLWVAFFNFGMQIASWPLIGLGLTLSLVVIDDLALRKWQAWPSLVIGAIVLASLPVTYYPALTIFVPMAGGLWLARGIERSRDRDPSNGNSTSIFFRASLIQRLIPLLIASLALAIATLIAAFPTIGDYYAGFAFRYSLVAQKIGPDRFITLNDTLGLTPFRLERGGEQPPEVFVWGGILALVPFALGLLFASKLEQPHSYRLRWLLALLPIVGYLAWLQYIRPYEYAFMKTSAYLGAPLWGLLMLGWQRLYERTSGDTQTRLRRELSRTGHGDTQTRRQHSALCALRSAFQRFDTPRLQRFISVSACLLIGLACGWSQYLIVAEHSQAPALFGRDLVTLENPARSIPADASVLVSSDERFVGPNNGLFASILYGHTLLGRIATAYYSQSVWPVGVTPAYALLAATEAPWPLELGASEIWRSQAVALYRFDPDSRWLLGRTRLYTHEPPSDPFSPAAMAIWRRAGPLVAIESDSSLQLTIGDTLLLACSRAGQPCSSEFAVPQPVGTPIASIQGQPGLRALRLTLAATEPCILTLHIAGDTAELAIPSGASQVDFQIEAPALLELQSKCTSDHSAGFESTSALALADASLRLVSSAVVGSSIHRGVQAAHVTLLTNRIAWSAVATQKNELISVVVRQHGPRHAVRAELTLIEDTFDNSRRLLHTLAALPTDGEWQLNYVPGRGAIEALNNGQPTALLAVDVQPRAPDGNYFAVLTLYSGEEPISNMPLYRVQILAGQIAAFEAIPYSVEIAIPGILGRSVADPSAPLPANQRSLLNAALALDARPAQIAQIILKRQSVAPGAGAAALFAPGDPLTAQIYWQANAADPRPLAISVQIIGPNDTKIAQWDGTAGGDWYPASAWAAGDAIRQDVPLTLRADALPGTYRLLLAAYDPTTGVAQPIAGQQAVVVGELLLR